MKKILVVDDSFAIQEIITYYFTKHTDYKVISAEDGEIGLDQVENDPPDIIILDVILPRINGLAFLSELRKIEGAKNIPVIMISGKMFDDAIKEEGFSLGAIDFLEKPINLSALHERINACFAGEES